MARKAWRGPANDLKPTQRKRGGTIPVTLPHDDPGGGDVPAGAVVLTFTPTDATPTIHGPTPTSTGSTGAGQRWYMLAPGNYGFMVTREGRFTAHHTMSYTSGAQTINLNLQAEPNFAAMTQRYLNPVSGSNSNNGQSAGSAWLTMQHAMQQASSLAIGSGVDVCVNVANGVIKEHNISHGNHMGSRTIAFRATNPGQVIWTGADAVTTWTQASGGAVNGLWHTPWTNDWGVPADPAMGMAPIGRRREMVFVNDVRMRQRYVTSGETYNESATITEVQNNPGSFFVDEVADRIYLNPPAGVNPTTANIEIAQRARSVYLQGYRNVIFSGFTWQRFASPINSHAIGAADQGFYWFLDCAWKQNNGAGWSYGNSAVVNDVRLVRCDFQENGIWGWGGSRINGFLVDTITERATGWRAQLGGQLGWWVGNKVLFVHNMLVRDYYSRDNAVRAFWPDTDVRNLLVVNFDAQNGVGFNPIFIEANQGPMVLDGLTLKGNVGGGLQLSESGNITMRNSIIENNLTVQVNGSGTASKTFTSPVDGQPYTAKPEYWDFQNNVIGSNSGAWLWLAGPSLAVFEGMLPTSVLNHNTYRSAAASDALFRRGNGTTTMNFAGWQSYTGKEANSIHSAYGEGPGDPGPGPGTDPYTDIVLHDTWGGVSGGTLINGRTPAPVNPSDTWLTETGAWAIWSGRAQPNTNDSVLSVNVDLSNAFSIHTNITMNADDATAPTASRNIGIVLNHSNELNRYAVIFSRRNDGGLNTVTLQRRQAGTNTTLASASGITLPASTTLAVDIIVNENRRAFVYLAGTLVLAEDLSTFGSAFTRVGASTTGRGTNGPVSIGAYMVKTDVESEPPPGNETGGLAIADAETGDLTQFTGTTQSGGNTITAAAAAARFGSYGYRYTWAGTNNGLHAAINVSNPEDLYLRFYFRLATGWAMPSLGQAAQLFAFRAGTDKVFHGAIHDVSGGPKFLMQETRPGVGTSSVYGGVVGQITRNVWHLLELRWRKHASTGGVQAWFNGAQVVNSMAWNTSAFTVTAINIGSGTFNPDIPTNGSIMDVDQVRLDTAPIGPWTGS